MQDLDLQRLGFPQMDVRQRLGWKPRMADTRGDDIAICYRNLEYNSIENGSRALISLSPVTPNQTVVEPAQQTLSPTLPTQSLSLV